MFDESYTTLQSHFDTILILCTQSSVFISSVYSNNTHKYIDLVPLDQVGQAIPSNEYELRSRTLD